MRPWPLTTWQAIADGTQFRYVGERLQSERNRVLAGSDPSERLRAGIAAGHLLAHVDFRSRRRTSLAGWTRELLELAPSDAGDEEIQWDWDDGLVIAIQRAIAYGESTLGQEEVLTALRSGVSLEAAGLGSHGPAIIPSDVSRADALLFCGDLQEAAALYAAAAAGEADPRWRLLLESQAALARVRVEPPEAVLKDLETLYARTTTIGDLAGHRLLLLITIGELFTAIGRADLAVTCLAEAKKFSFKVKHPTLEGVRLHALAVACEQTDARMGAMSAANDALAELDGDEILHDSEQHARTIETLCRLSYRYRQDSYVHTFRANMTAWTEVALVTTASRITAGRLDLAAAYNEAAVNAHPASVAAVAVHTYEYIADHVYEDGRHPRLDEVLVLQRAAELASELAPPSSVQEPSSAEDAFYGLHHVAPGSAHAAIAGARIAAHRERLGHVEPSLQWSQGVVGWAAEDRTRAVADDDVAACHARLGTALYLSRDERADTARVVLAGAGRDHARLVERMALDWVNGVWRELLALRQRTAVLAAIALDPDLALDDAQITECAELLVTRKGLVRSAFILDQVRRDASRLMLPQAFVDGVSRDLTRRASLSELAAALPEDTLLVEFLVVGDVMSADLRRRFNHELVIAVVAWGAKVTIVEVGRVGQIAQRAREVRAVLAGPDTPPATASDAVMALDDSVWGPVQRVAPSNVRRIVAGIDGALGVCPVLLSARLAPGGGPFAGVRVHVVESLTALTRPQLPPSPEPPLVIGDPDYDAGGGGFAYWEPLPGAAEETEAVAQRLGVTPITGAAATTQAVLAAYRPRVVHIACHGENTALEDALQSSLTNVVTLTGASRASTLALAGANTSAAGTLSAGEVQQLRLVGTELVVLAGCQTAEGVPAPGEDVIGLRAAFRLAGAGAVLGSLWAVEDGVTRGLMTDFYDRWLAGENLLDALTGAQEAVRVTEAHPFYWAGWTLLGGCCG